MSSTKRNAERKDQDYYSTPRYVVDDFLDTIWDDVFTHIPKSSLILEPCAGGSPDSPTMPYVEALSDRGFSNILTMDIREDSTAEVKADYLSYDFPFGKSPHLVITNPPFSHAEEIARRALFTAKSNGVVVMLQRIGWLESRSREDFWKTYPPTHIVAHAKRIAFGGGRKTDSCMYAHFVWHMPSVGKQNTCFYLVPWSGE